jgi:hypothetical protein
MKLVVCAGWSPNHPGVEKVLRVEQWWDLLIHTKTHAVCNECKIALRHRVADWIARLADDEEKDSGNT